MRGEYQPSVVERLLSLAFQVLLVSATLKLSNFAVLLFAVAAAVLSLFALSPHRDQRFTRALAGKGMLQSVGAALFLTFMYGLWSLIFIVGFSFLIGGNWIVAVYCNTAFLFVRFFGGRFVWVGASKFNRTVPSKH